MSEEWSREVNSRADIAIVIEAMRNDRGIDYSKQGLTPRQVFQQNLYNDVQVLWMMGATPEFVENYIRGAWSMLIKYQGKGKHNE